MQSSTVQIRIDPILKQKAEILFRNIGLDTATAIRLFFTQSLLRGTIPFEIMPNNSEITGNDTPRKNKGPAKSKG